MKKDNEYWFEMWKSSTYGRVIGQEGEKDIFVDIDLIGYENDDETKKLYKLKAEYTCGNQEFTMEQFFYPEKISLQLIREQFKHLLFSIQFVVPYITKDGFLHTMWVNKSGIVKRVVITPENEVIFTKGYKFMDLFKNWRI